MRPDPLGYSSSVHWKAQIEQLCLGPTRHSILHQNPTLSLTKVFTQQSANNRQKDKGDEGARLIKDGIVLEMRNNTDSETKNVESVWVERRNSKKWKEYIGPSNSYTMRQNITQDIMGACKKDTAIIMGTF